MLGQIVQGGTLHYPTKSLLSWCLDAYLIRLFKGWLGFAMAAESFRQRLRLDRTEAPPPSNPARSKCFLSGSVRLTMIRS